MKAHLTQLLATAAKTIAPDSADLSILLERPKSAEHGDFATNLALVLATDADAVAIVDEQVAVARVRRVGL